MAGTMLLCGCFVATRDHQVGNDDAGNGGGGGGTEAMGGGIVATGGGTAVGGGTVVGGGAVIVGDAPCDQSECLAPTGMLAHLKVRQMLLDGSTLYVVGNTYDTYLGELISIDTRTGTQTLLVASNPARTVDGEGPLRLVNGWLYFSTNWSSEIYGVPYRVRVSDRIVENLGPDIGGGSPASFPYDTDGVEMAYLHNRSLYRSVMPITATTPVALVALDSGEVVADVALTSTHVWYAGSSGLKRVARGGGTPEVMLTGSFTRLRFDGVYPVVAGEHAGTQGVFRVENSSTFTTLVTAAAADFSLARAAALYAEPTNASNQTRVLDASGAVVMAGLTVGTDGVLSAVSPQPLIAADATHVFVGTADALYYRSEATPNASCGCGLTQPVLPSTETGCAHQLCPGSTTIIARPLQHGAIEGDRLVGVFGAATGTDQITQLISVQPGGAPRIFDTTSLGPDFAADSNAFYVTTGTTLSAVPRDGGTAVQILGVSAAPQYGTDRDGPRLAVASSTNTVVYSSHFSLRSVATDGTNSSSLVGGDSYSDISFVEERRSLHLLHHSRSPRPGRHRHAGVLRGAGRRRRNHFRLRPRRHPPLLSHRARARAGSQRRRLQDAGAARLDLRRPAHVAARRAGWRPGGDGRGERHRPRPVSLQAVDRRTRVDHLAPRARPDEDRGQRRRRLRAGR